MTDRELLELAAKAAGEGLFYEWVQDGRTLRYVGLREWNPLIIDGDAFRLAVKLGMEVTADDDATHFPFAYARICGNGDDHTIEPIVDNACKALRRAIVRAAAEFGAAQ